MLTASETDIVTQTRPSCSYSWSSLRVVAELSTGRLELTRRNFHGVTIPDSQARTAKESHPDLRDILILYNDTSEARMAECRSDSLNRSAYRGKVQPASLQSRRRNPRYMKFERVSDNRYVMI
jgi:hypothetical protein